RSMDKEDVIESIVGFGDRRVPREIEKNTAGESWKFHMANHQKGKCQRPFFASDLRDQKRAPFDAFRRVPPDVNIDCRVFDTHRQTVRLVLRLDETESEVHIQRVIGSPQNQNLARDGALYAKATA